MSLSPSALTLSLGDVSTHTDTVFSVLSNTTQQQNGDSAHTVVTLSSKTHTLSICQPSSLSTEWTATLLASKSSTLINTEPSLSVQRFP